MIKIVKVLKLFVLNFPRSGLRVHTKITKAPLKVTWICTFSTEREWVPI